jgi:hypothetical protein
MALMRSAALHRVRACRAQKFTLVRKIAALAAATAPALYAVAGPSQEPIRRRRRHTTIFIQPLNRVFRGAAQHGKDMRLP